MRWHVTVHVVACNWTYIYRENEEHIDPHSYSWYLMRLAIIKHVVHSLNRFLALIGFEPAGMYTYIVHWIHLSFSYLTNNFYFAKKILSKPIFYLLLHYILRRCDILACMKFLFQERSCIYISVQYNFCTRK